MGSERAVCDLSPRPSPPALFLPHHHSAFSQLPSNTHSSHTLAFRAKPLQTVAMAPTTATKKAAAAKKPASHPTFLSMIQEAIKAHPEEARGGVSRPTLKKFLADKYKIDMSSASNVNNLSNAIKRGAEKGDLTLPKGIGGRVKLPAKKAPAGKENVAPKPAKKPVAKKAPAAKKPAAAPAPKKAAAPKPAKTVKKPAAAKKAPAAKKTSAPKKAPAAKAAAAKAVAKKAAPKKKAAPAKKA